MWLVLLLTSSATAILVREPAPPMQRSRANPVEGWTTIRLNHFDASNTDTFQMRYYYNNEFATTNNMVIYVGGEWEITPDWVTGGLAHELAENIGAGLIYTEHRYYGKTRPTNTTSTKELRFLNVDQALGDLAQFIQYVQSDDFDDGRFRGGKVSLVGCSYAGSMATWMRLGYPHLVTAAFSDSGPVLAKEEFPEYMEVMSDALRSQGGEECEKSVVEAMGQMLTMLSNGGVDQVSEMFKTCTPINATNELDVVIFVWYGIILPLAVTVQNAGEGDVTTTCKALTDPAERDPLHRLAAWVRSLPWADECLETRYEQFVDYCTDTSYDSPFSVLRLWMYQICVEYGWFQTTSSDRQPFLSTIPIEYFHSLCRDYYGEYFDEAVLRRGIERSNLMWGGRRSQPDGVIAVAGSLDPWHPVGPYPEHATPLAPVYFVPEVSHCRAVRSTGESNHEELERVKLAVLRGMQDLMEGRPPYSGFTYANSCFTAIVTLVSLHIFI